MSSICKYTSFYFFISYLTKAGKKHKGRGFTKTWEETRPGRDVQTAPGDCFGFFYIDLQDNASIFNILF